MIIKTKTVENCLMFTHTSGNTCRPCVNVNISDQLNQSVFSVLILPAVGRKQSENSQVLPSAVHPSFGCLLIRNFVFSPQLDKVPRLSIIIVILILPSDTLFGDDLYCICFDHPSIHLPTDTGLWRNTVHPDKLAGWVQISTLLCYISLLSG